MAKVQIPDPIAKTGTNVGILEEDSEGQRFFEKKGDLGINPSSLSKATARPSVPTYLGKNYRSCPIPPPKQSHLSHIHRVRKRMFDSLSERIDHVVLQLIEALKGGLFFPPFVAIISSSQRGAVSHHYWHEVFITQSPFFFTESV